MSFNEHELTCSLNMPDSPREVGWHPGGPGTYFLFSVPNKPFAAEGLSLISPTGSVITYDAYHLSAHQYFLEPSKKPEKHEIYGISEMPMGVG